MKVIFDNISGKCQIEGKVPRGIVCEWRSKSGETREESGEFIGPNGIKDFREAINPKHPAPDADFEPKPYYQVYQQKHGFLPNLSVLDLLMNMGPESIYYL